MPGKKALLSGTEPMSAAQLSSLIHGLSAPTSEFQDSLTASLKLIYDKAVALSSAPYGPFDQLVVDGIDPDSIWEEIQSRNDPLTAAILKKLASLVDAGDEDEVDDDGEYAEDNEEEEDIEGEGPNEEDDSNSDGEEYGALEEGEEANENNDEEDEDDDDDDDDDDIEVEGGDDYEDEDAMDPARPLTEDEEGDMEEHLDQLEREEMRREERNARKLQNRGGHKGVLEVRILSQAC